MSNLESLVPPLELCKQIPAGMFEDSALVRLFQNGKPHPLTPIITRELVLDGEEKYPAPTLAEIMLALDGLDEGDLPTCTFTGVKWRMESVSGPFSATIKRHHTSDRNPATAAMKLWLELNKEQISNLNEEENENF